MPNLNFLSVQAKNYQSFKSLNFEFAPGRHAVLGADVMTGSSNGVGKSTIFEALVWGLYKQSPRGNDPSTNGKGSCEVKVDFQVDGRNYQIHRFLKLPKLGNGVKLYSDGEDISARISTEVDAQIASLIGIPHDLFISACVVLQGIPMNFTQFTPSMRKSVFESVLGFSVWDEYKSKFDKKAKEYQYQINEIEQECAPKEREMVALNSKIETLSQVNKESGTELAAELRELKKEISELESSIAGASEKIHLQLEKAEFDSYDAFESTKNNFERHLQTQRTQLKNFESLIHQGKCPTCDTSYSEDKLGEARDKIKACNLTIEQLVGDLERLSQVEDAIVNLQNCMRDYNSTLRTKKSDLSKKIAEFGKLKENNEIAPLQETLAKLVDEVNEMNAKAKHIKEEANLFGYVSGVLMPSSQFRTKVLIDYIAIVSSIIKTISPIVFAGVDIHLEVNAKATGIDIITVRDGKEIQYTQLSGGEKRRLDLIIILSIQKFLLEASGIYTNLFAFDEVFDALDSLGVDSVIDCLEVLFVPESCVYVISHNNSIKTRFDSSVQIVKEFGVSKIV